MDTSSASQADQIGLQPHPLTLRLFKPANLAKLALVVGSVTLFPFVIQRLPDLKSRPEYRLKSCDLQVVPAPQHPVPALLLEQVCQRGQFPTELSVLDTNLCRDLASAFSKHPWVARVVSVKTTFPSSVVVQVEYRRPVAMVQVKGGRVPIDAEGTVLPAEDFSASDIANYPTIRLAGASDIPQPEIRFRMAGLRGAVQVAEILGSKWNKLNLEAIELPRLRDEPKNSDEVQFTLTTKVGSSILWGRAPDSVHPGELTSSQKIARLEKYLEQFGRFDRPNGPYEIDIRHWQEITRSPLGKVQTATRKDLRQRR